MIGEVFDDYYSTETPKKMFFLNAHLTVYAVMFCKQFLAYTVHIDMSAFLYNP